MDCLRVLTGIFLFILAGISQAQTYPNKPVRLVIAFTPGSSIDIVGRAVAAKLSEIWGQPVVAENRAGAGGSIGSKVVADAAPDGYTLLANSSAHVANPGIYAKLPYDTLKDFTNLAILGSTPNVLITGQETGWKTLKDFVAAAKANPGKLNFLIRRHRQRHALQPGEAQARARDRRRARAVQGHARGDRRHHRRARLLLLGAAQCRAAPRQRRQGGRAGDLERQAHAAAAERADRRRAGLSGLRLHALARPLGARPACPPTLPPGSTGTSTPRSSAPTCASSSRGSAPSRATSPSRSSPVFVRKEIDETQRILSAAGIKPQ
jgi:hypothetical protein